MRKVYEDQDMTMVGYYQSVLEEEGIETSIKNEYAQMAMGEVPFTQVYPELWVSNDAHYAKAVKTIKSLRDNAVVGDIEAGEKPLYKSPLVAGMLLWLAVAAFLMIATLLMSYFLVN